MATTAIGGRVISLGSVDSTNNYAADLLAGGGVHHGTVILAREQTAGRGQRGRVWRSGDGLDLTASVILVPEHMRVSDQFGLSKLVAVAVHDVVAGSLIAAGRDPVGVRIKWPNDVLVDRHKIAGILIKNEVMGSLIRSSVVGIGLNVNSLEWEEGLLATSLRQETGREEAVDAVLERLCLRLEELWATFDPQAPSLSERYGSLLWSRGRFVALERDGEPWTARPMDVDADGRLLVEDTEGSVHAYGLERLRFGPR
ncbi:MAG TPA: biotin--[acetyl-CoA-carboxylase] ligase [Flavobacteriales bacterium]